jgi:excisionase family DNA binding protein
MSKRHPNPRLVKIHRSYTVEEIASLFGIHKNTVREWVKNGLPVTDDRRPMLVLGRELGAFLQAKRIKNKRPCQPGEIYCVRCHSPRKPAASMAEYQPLTLTSGNLVGICPSCESMMYRRVNLVNLVQVGAKLDVTYMQALPHINESPQPCVNSDSN